MKKFGSLLGFIALAQVVGGAPGVVTRKSIKDGGYERLDKPKWTPLVAANTIFNIPILTINYIVIQDKDEVL